MIHAADAEMAGATQTPLQPLDDLVVDAVDDRGQVFVAGLGVAIADDDDATRAPRAPHACPMCRLLVDY
jgi:hypothetical protein